MRHLVANIATYTIAALLILGSALFAWMRSSQLVLSDEYATLARYEPTPEHDFEWREVGEHAYASNCRNCHGREGLGWDQYPGLTDTARLFAAPGGREYLVELHLHGLTSPRWGAPMPSMGHLQDVELAAVLNHVLTHFGNTPPTGARLYVPADIAALRGPKRSPWEVNALRPGGDARAAEEGAPRRQE